MKPKSTKDYRGPLKNVKKHNWFINLLLNFTNLKQYNWDFYEEYFDKITYNGRKDLQQIKQVF